MFYSSNSCNNLFSLRLLSILFFKLFNDGAFFIVDFYFNLLQRFRSRSRSRSFTPPHWRKELQRQVKEKDAPPPQAFSQKWAKGDNNMEDAGKGSAKSRLGDRRGSLAQRFETEEKEEG